MYPDELHMGGTTPDSGVLNAIRSINIFGYIDETPPEQKCGRMYAPMDISVFIDGKFVDPLACFTQAEMLGCLLSLFPPTQKCSKMNSGRNACMPLIFSDPPRNAQT